MKHPRLIASYFFQKTCYHGNHIMHSVAPPKSKAIALLREQIGEIFSNSYITCYKEWFSKYTSLKKFCRADERKKPTFRLLLFKFFSHSRNFLKNGIYTHPIDLSCHQKFEKNSLTGSGNISVRSWKIWKSHGRLDPTLRMREVVHAHAKQQAFHSDAFFVTKGYFSFWSFYGLQEKQPKPI